MGAPDLAGRRVARGAVALVATLQLVLAEVLAASAWSPLPYSMVWNPYADLGVPECVVEPRVVCSPQWLVMDAALVVQGLLVLVALVALVDLVPGRWRRALVVPGFVLAIGFAIAGVAPAVASGDGGVRDAAHALGTVLVLVGGALAPVVAGFGLLRQWRGWAVLSIVLGAAVAIASIVGAVAGATIGVGLADRLALYPVLLWLVLTGFAVLVARRSQADRARIRAAQDGS